MGDLVLSLFPGIDLLGRAFEEAGFTVVRGPDRLWGGSIETFHPPAGLFSGIIGGPPCQAHSSFTHINRAQGNAIAEDLVPEFLRCVQEAAPGWWLMENSPAVPDAAVPGYRTTRIELDNRWLGQEQARRRAFQFGTPDGRTLSVELAAFDHPNVESTCLASEGGSGRILRRRTAGGGSQAVYKPRRPFDRFCELQGLPGDFLAGAPFTVEGKYLAVGNGVPMPLGRAVARAVKAALSPHTDEVAQ